MAQSQAQQQINQYLLLVGIFRSEGFQAIESSYGVLVYFDTIRVPIDVAMHVLWTREIDFLFECKQTEDGVLIKAKH